MPPHFTLPLICLSWNLTDGFTDVHQPRHQTTGIFCASHLNSNSARLSSLPLSDYFSVRVHKGKLRRARLCCCIPETRQSWLLVWLGGGKKKMAEAGVKMRPRQRHLGSAHQTVYGHKKRGCCPPPPSEDRCYQRQLFKVVQHVLVQEWRHRLTLESKVAFLRVSD